MLVLSLALWVIVSASLSLRDSAKLCCVFSRLAFPDSRRGLGEFGKYVLVSVSGASAWGWLSPTARATFQRLSLFFCQIVTKCPDSSGFCASRPLLDSHGPVVTELAAPRD